jgi:hypothetical protein
LKQFFSYEFFYENRKIISHEFELSRSLGAMELSSQKAITRAVLRLLLAELTVRLLDHSATTHDHERTEQGRKRWKRRPL